MASTTKEIRQALADTLADTYGEDWQTFPYLKSQPTPPLIDVMPGPIMYDAANARGMDDVTYIVRAMVAFNDDHRAQERLDELLDLDPSSATSMKNALETHDAGDLSHRSTLGGVVSDLRVTDASEYKTYPGKGGTDLLLGVEFTVTVIP